MPGKPDFALAGTMPGDHGLHSVRAGLQSDPRARRIAIIEFCARDTKTHRPEDGDDEVTDIITILSLEPIIATGEADQARAMMAKARATRPGQGQLGDDETASAASG